MSQRINILVASPSDVPEERNAVPRVFTHWNERNSYAFLHPKMWESAAVPELGGPPQPILDRQLIDECDLLIAILWSRLGTPTPTDRSGTLEEIREFAARKGEQRVMVYFCNRPVSINIDIEEFRRLREFREEMKSKGLYAEFITTDQFESQLYPHLDKKVEDCVDNRLPIPTQQSNQSPDPKVIASQSNAPVDPRLRLSIDFGTTLTEIAAAFLKRMQNFVQIDGGSADKFLALGSHVYNSCAECLDRLLSRRGNAMNHTDKNGIDRIITQLRTLADSAGEYRKKFPAFWDEGMEIAQTLDGRAKRSHR